MKSYEHCQHCHSWCIPVSDQVDKPLGRDRQGVRNPSRYLKNRVEKLTVPLGSDLSAARIQMDVPENVILCILKMDQNGLFISIHLTPCDVGIPPISGQIHITITLEKN